jgi:hypothetical protein
MIVELTDSTRSGDEPDRITRLCASDARTSGTGTYGLLQICSSHVCQTILVNNSYFDWFYVGQWYFRILI